jgi:hypothetical protein
MASSYLTATAITRAAVATLHQKLNFIGACNKQYDDSYKNGGGTVRGKFGPTLKVRLPNEYTVRSGINMSAQEQSEQSVDLTVSTIKGVDMYFTSEDLALSIEDFTPRFIEPAMAVLAANIEADALSMYKDVYNLVDGDTVAFGYNSVSEATTRLTKMLAPLSGRTMILDPDHANKFRQDTKALQHPGSDLTKQWRDGVVGMTSGFEMYENTLLVPHQTGDAAKTTTVSVNGTVTANGSAQMTVTNGSAKTFKVGDVFTVAGTYRVHPETKVSTGVLQQFVVTEDAASTTIKFAPAIYTSGPRQNISSTGLLTSSALVKVGAGADETLKQSLAFHKDAFAFVTADLELPKGVDFAAREVMDGISMSLVRDFQVSYRSFPCRLDVMYGYKAIRPQLATRIHYDG